MGSSCVICNNSQADEITLQGPLVLEFVAALPVGKSDSKKLLAAYEDLLQMCGGQYHD